MFSAAAPYIPPPYKYPPYTVPRLTTCLNSDKLDDNITGCSESLLQYGVDDVIYVLPDRIKFT